MPGHMISVCIFCFLCATHSPCASHAATSRKHTSQHTYNPVSKSVPDPERLKPYSSLNVLDSAIKNGRMHRLEKRNSDISSSVNSDKEVNFIKKIFELYGDGESMNIQGFQSLLTHLNDFHQHSTNSQHPILQQVKMSEVNETDINNKTVSHLIEFLIVIHF